MFLTKSLKRFLKIHIQTNDLIKSNFKKIVRTQIIKSIFTAKNEIHKKFIPSTKTWILHTGKKSRDIKKFFALFLSTNWIILFYIFTWKKRHRNVATSFSFLASWYTFFVVSESSIGYQNLEKIAWSVCFQCHWLIGFDCCIDFLVFEKDITSLEDDSVCGYAKFCIITFLTYNNSISKLFKIGHYQ